MTLNNSSFPSNQTTGHGDTTTKTHGDLLLCPPVPNVRFETLDSSLSCFLNAALNVPLAIATTVANLVVLLAMRRVTSIRLPSKLLLCSLVLTDLGAGSVAQPQFAAILLLRAIYLHQDLPPFTSSADSTPSSRPSAATGRKHTEHGEVQENSVRHDVDLRASPDLLPPLLVHGRIHCSCRTDSSRLLSL